MRTRNNIHVVLLQCELSVSSHPCFYTLINYQQLVRENDNNALYTVNHVNIADLSINCQIIHQNFDQMLKQNKTIYYRKSRTDSRT